VQEEHLQSEKANEFACQHSKLLQGDRRVESRRQYISVLLQIVVLIIHQPIKRTKNSTVPNLLIANECLLCIPYQLAPWSDEQPTCQPSENDREPWCRVALNSSSQHA